MGGVLAQLTFKALKIEGNGLKITIVAMALLL
jgi:hypothetical protein